MIMVGFIGTRDRRPWPEKLAEPDRRPARSAGSCLLNRNVADRQSARALNASSWPPAAQTWCCLQSTRKAGHRAADRGSGFSERPSARDVAGPVGGRGDGDLCRARPGSPGMGVQPQSRARGRCRRQPGQPDHRRPRPELFRQPRALSPPTARSLRDRPRQRGRADRSQAFPGHGSSREDSHKGFVDITRTWTPAELLPYRRLIADGLADMVMPGHLYSRRFPSPKSLLPSSLSKVRWICSATTSVSTA